MKGEKTAKNCSADDFNIIPHSGVYYAQEQQFVFGLFYEN